VSIAIWFTRVRFVDTNVLLYTISRDPREREKAALANELLASRDLGLSVQVLQEFYVQATRESRADRLTDEQAATLVDSFRRFPVQETTVGVALAAISTKQRYGISYWDAAILEAARALGCDVVVSEDLSDGQDYAGVRVENPFRAPSIQ
jgi:predicted nucleic acid-binding protein